MNLPVRVPGAVRLGWWILAGSAGVLACRLATTPIVPAVESGVGSGAKATSTHQASLPPPLVQTPTALRPTPSPTPVYGPVEVEAGRVANPPELQLDFHVLFEDLPSGWIVLYSDDVTGDLMYRQMETNRAGSFLSVLSPVGESARGLFSYLWLREPKTSLVGWLGDPITRYVIDLRRQEVVRLGEMCNEYGFVFSPSGRKLATLCDREGSPEGEASWLEIDLLDEPRRLRYTLPISRSRYGPSTLRWLTDDSLVLLGGGDGQPCVLDLNPVLFTCLEGSKPGEFLEASEDGRYIVVWSTLTGTWDVAECEVRLDSCPDTLRIYDATCIRKAKDCPPELELVRVEDLRGGVAVPAPDGSAIAYAGGWNQWTNVGVITLDDGTFSRLGRLPPYFGFVDWCPDSKCFLVAPGGNQPYAKSYFIYLDGHQEALDIADPMAILEIP